jgi:hypothetical protein
MYYFYGIQNKVAFLKDEGDLTDLQKEYATTFLEDFPEKLPYKEGFLVRLYIEPETLDVSYIYEEDTINV